MTDSVLQYLEAVCRPSYQLLTRVLVTIAVDYTMNYTRFMSVNQKQPSLVYNYSLPGKNVNVPTINLNFPGHRGLNLPHICDHMDLHTLVTETKHTLYS